ncbi:rhomboid family intramembrane serine protease [Lentibacillus sp.]|jgi:membrane associated rhomboid family serine protease|uniref:rhomboid family intramembrane serine protease n=1 Tax=Lentibacillus sp. TaxID=1925746 RepID=UPI002B4AF06F|nr:rhomboid family intramembrane serine protease [Lentibacillus sp.]HLS07799.1 rhomboid family intramembrane serine protease [Lentibacillus sp.]
MFVRNERSIKEFMQLYPVVAWIIIIQLVLWFLTGFLHTPLGRLIENWGMGVNFYISQGEYWRLLTSIFLHAGLMHVLFNSFALVLFGPALEQMLGKLKFLAAYLGAGLIGNLATLLLGPALYSHVGASGAIYGLFGIYVFMVAFRKHLIDQSSAQIITVILVIGLVVTFLRSGINVYAHVFGFIGGFAIAPLVLENVRPYNPWVRRQHTDDGSIQFNPDRWQKKHRNKKILKNSLWIFLGILVVLGLFSRLF